MKFIVFNGSPKGSESVTLRYFQFVAKNFPEHQYKIYEIGRKIKRYEKIDNFNMIINDVESADGVIFLFPVYICFIPSQLKRFLELIIENKAEKAFHKKYATAISTSERFYDYTAHDYLHGMCEDLNMYYYRGFSARMFDLKDEEYQRNLIKFATNYFNYCKEKLIIPKRYYPLKTNYQEYIPPKDLENVPKIKNDKIVIVTNVINVNEIDMKGGCHGCCKCTYDNVCFYNDEHNERFKEAIDAKVLIYAFTLRDRYFSARVKMFQDRAFFNGHRPMFKDQQQAWIISGPLRQLTNIRQLIDAISQVGRANLSGIVTDENDSDTTTLLLKNLANEIIWSVENNFTRPRTFLGEGGHKIFRDL